MFRRARGFIRGDRGAVAPLVAIAIIAIVGMGALAWDVSRAFALRAELDAAVDAAALAGASQLDGNAGAIDRAIAAAKGAIVQNAQRLANSPEANVVIRDADIQFMTSITASPRVYLDKTLSSSSTSANFIQINLSNNQRLLGLVTGRVLSTMNFQVNAHAVAGYGSALCKVPPLVVCNPLETSSIRDFDPNQHIGKGITLKSEPGRTWGPGNFGYLSVTGSDGIKEAMGRVSPQIQCFGTTVETQPGNVNAADQYFNTRFGYYQGSANSKSSDPEYMPSQNTITGRGNACTASLPTYTSCGSGTPAAMGLPRDCCGYGSGSCSGPPNPLGDGDWERSVYKAVNHSASVYPTDWNSYGPAPVGSIPTPTRYQLYKWENTLIAAGSTGEFSNNASDSYGASCYTGSPAPIPARTPDRRTISVVVANCKFDDVTGTAIDFNGRTDLRPIAYMDIFLTEPVDLSGTGASERLGMYGEIIGATSDVSAVGRETKLYSVRLYE